MKFDGSVNALIKASGKPPFIYGTAWKKEETTRLVKEALAAGFTAVDTAAQPKHYQEDLVGKALREAYTEGILKREDLYVRLSRNMHLKLAHSIASYKRNSLRPMDKTLRTCHMTQSLPSIPKSIRL